MQIRDLCVHRASLANGLRVVCIPQPLLHTACVSLHLLVGSRYETGTTNGRSHMLEHMLYRGTPSFPDAHSLALGLERLGGTLFAATHTDHGIMSISLPPENLASAFAIFAEITREPSLVDIDKERGIIAEEILEALNEDNEQIDPDNLSRELMFGDHGLGLPITGSLASIEAIDVRALQEHHEAFYAGRNAVLSFAGAIDPDACVRLAEQHLGSLRAGEPARLVPAPVQRSPRFRYVQNQGSQTDLRLAFRAPAEHDPQEPATEVLVRLLDDGMSTRLYASVCDDKGLCYDVSADYETFADDGVLDLAAAVQHERAPRVMRELCAIVSDLTRNGPTDDELRMCKDRHRWELRAVLDDAEGLADFHGITELARISDSLAARGDEIESVTREQVVEAARRIFRREHVNGVAVGVLRRGQRRELESAMAEFDPG
jgi:predicted Zn-dependent peptidase